MKKIVKNGRIFTEAEDYQADILIEDEKIVCIGTDISDADAEAIDAAGCYVLPWRRSAEERRPLWTIWPSGRRESRYIISLTYTGSWQRERRSLIMDFTGQRSM